MEELEIIPEGEAPQQPDAPTEPAPEAPPAENAELEPAVDPVVEPAVDTVAGWVAAPVAAPVAEPDIDPPAEPSAEAVAEPIAELIAERGIEPPAEPAPVIPVEDLLTPPDEPPAPALMEDVQLMAVLEAVVYVAEEPLTMAQIAAALQQPVERVDTVLRQLIAELEKPGHGIAIREVAGGFKMATKPEHHEAVRSFVKSLKPPMKLSLPALETLAVIAYKQPVTAPEIMEIRGVQGAGVLKTLLDRKLIAVAGRKNVIGKPILYKTTRDFLIQFGLNDVGELPSLKEFEDIRRMAFADSEPVAQEPVAEEASPAGTPQPQPPPEPAAPDAVPDPPPPAAAETVPDPES